MEIIDNKNKKMGDVINNVMPFAQNLYFRTGYFFFSGYKEIYKNIKDKKVKILVGKDIQRDLAGIIQELNYSDLSHKPKNKVRRDYFNSLISTFRDVNEVDNGETAEAYKVFKGKLLDGSLEIRKTLQPDHSKVYIFENSSQFNQNGEYLGSVIKGSSNLTFSGLVGQYEDNELHKDNEYFKRYKKTFDELWETSIELIDKNHFVEFEKDVINKIWIEQLPNPYSVYLRVLDEYFSLSDEEIITPSKITSDKSDFKYQIDAIKESLSIIHKHNGVILADVVGLGKSIIGSCIAKNLNVKTIIICPPHLIPQWEDYRYEFGVNAKVYGSGSVLKALEENKDNDEKLIIVDEAHKFRNEEKSMYATLHRLCKGNKVVLLTATPFNNDPKDIFSLIKLFQIPAKSTIQTIDNLSLRFKELIKQYNMIKKFKKKESEKMVKFEIEKLANNMQDLIGPLLIRRSRLDLMNRDDYRKDLELQKIEFPIVNPPIPLDYDFGELGDLYIRTLEMIVPEESNTGFKGARYNIFDYLPEENLKKIAKVLNTEQNLLKNSLKNISIFMKRLLVHRFESSVDAFRITLDNMIDSHLKVQDWLNQGKVPIYKKGDIPDIEDLYDSSDGDETLEEVNEIFEAYTEKGLVVIDAKDIKESFASHLASDIALLKKIKELWQSFDPSKDPKIKKIKNEISRLFSDNKQRKIVIFSLYSDTVNYVYSQLKDDYKIFKYSAADSSEANKKTIRENFDAGHSIQKNDFEILIATDAISEGYNLHRAGVIFNYDIPYNPTRVIQRVGRINRINKKVYPELFIYNFFPSPTGEYETGIKRISTLKIDVIKALLGDDTKYLSVDEIVTSYNTRFTDEMNQLESLSWDTKYRNLLSSLRTSEELKTSHEIPVRTKIRREKQDINGILIFGKKGKDYAFKIGYSQEDIKSITALEAIQLFEATKEEMSHHISPSFFSMYDFIKKNLFIRKSEIPKDKGLRDALEKIDWLKENKSEFREYFEDIEYVMKDLGDLPAKIAKTIRSIDKEDLDEGIKDLQKEAPHDYILRIIEKADEIEEGAESLILAEEF